MESISRLLVPLQLLRHLMVKRRPTNSKFPLVKTKNDQKSAEWCEKVQFVARLVPDKCAFVNTSFQVALQLTAQFTDETHLMSMLNVMDAVRETETPTTTQP